MGVLSLVIGMLVSIGVCVGLIPLLGWLNWVNIPVAFIGAIFGFVDMVRYKQPGQSRAAGIIGFILCVLGLLVAAARLVIGAGIL